MKGRRNIQGNLTRIHSKLAKQIESDENGIENLDYKNLAEDLIENELAN